VIPISILSSVAFSSWIWPAAGIAGGIYLFVLGFKMLQRKRLILNTPTSKIRSASLGLVEVNGLAVGPYTLTAPITAAPCFFYRTQAWELRKSGKSNEWQQVADESLHVPFFLDDNTGRLLINPQGAELDIHRDFHEEYSSSIFFDKEMPERCRQFLARYAVSGERKVRVDEYCIKPKNFLFILGTLAENPGTAVVPQPVRTQPASSSRFTLNLPGGSRGTFTISVGKTIGYEPEPVPLKSLPQPSLIHRSVEVINLSDNQLPAASAEMTQQGKITAALMRAGITNPAAWNAAGIDNPGAAVATFAGTAVMSSASLDASATTSAAAGPAQEFDLQPKVVLMKGENNPAFFISWRNERAIAKSLGWKSALCIWGGPALILLGAYVLLAQFSVL
jgi:E3 ubiquitin ligase